MKVKLLVGAHSLHKQTHINKAKKEVKVFLTSISCQLGNKDSRKMDYPKKIEAR